MTEQGIHNFSSSSPRTSSTSNIVFCADFADRLPTLSANQALKNLSSTPHSPISTRLGCLDRLLQGWDHESLTQDELPGGISRSEVTEIVGPPGVGKTSLAWVTSLYVQLNQLEIANVLTWIIAFRLPHTYSNLGSQSYG